MGKKFYSIAAPLIRLCTPKLKAEWEVPFDGEPGIFVANHERAIGPLEMATRFPLLESSHIWIYAAPLDRKTTPEYVRNDHWWDENSRLAPLWNAVIPPVVSLILPPILRSVPYVAVHNDGRGVSAIKESLRLLQAGRNIVLFPEMTTAYRSAEQEKMNEGWLMMLPMYAKRTGKPLKVWPVRLDLEANRMRIRAPFTMDETRSLQEQTGELTHKVLCGIFDLP